MEAQAIRQPSVDGHLLALPAEIRIAILEYVFERNRDDVGFKDHGIAGGIVLDEDYNGKARLGPLLTCRQLYRDAGILALQRTTFTVTNLFYHIPERLALLDREQIRAIRHVALIADARHFRNLPSWGVHPFGLADLRLDTLTIALHRSSACHYLFDFTADLVKLLRHLGGVRRLVFVRNRALVKGSFKTWYNRLVGLLMKVDHRERYMVCPPRLETAWWTWSFDETAQTFCLAAAPPKPLVEEVAYMQQILPIMDELRVSMENEEWNPDPRSRNGA